MFYTIYWGPTSKDQIVWLCRCTPPYLGGLVQFTVPRHTILSMAFMVSLSFAGNIGIYIIFNSSFANHSTSRSFVTYTLNNVTKISYCKMRCLCDCWKYGKYCSTKIIFPHFVMKYEPYASYTCFICWLIFSLQRKFTKWFWHYFTLWVGMSLCHSSFFKERCVKLHLIQSTLTENNIGLVQKQSNWKIHTSVLIKNTSFHYK